VFGDVLGIRTNAYLNDFINRRNAIQVEIAAEARRCAAWPIHGNPGPEADFERIVGPVAAKAPRTGDGG
jgi:hypothetical protein